MEEHINKNDEYNYKKVNKLRESGIIMHITSLPSKYGIGTFGKAAYDFVDFLKDANQKYWQVLPLGPTTYGDSPYQSYSSFAGNPYFIDFDILKDIGLLELEDYENVNFGHNEEEVDYSLIYNNKMDVLRKAFNRARKLNWDYSEFLEENKEWIYDYALFMALKEYFNGVSWINWDNDIKLREEKAVEHYREKLSKEMEFHYFLQLNFFKQYEELKKYANDNGIKIIGDLPIYVAPDSCDIWVDYRYFKVDENHEPITVGGCPPDDFTEDGQLWGNPVYNWKALRDDGYKWWIKRMKINMKLFDKIRIDHFRGFESFWEIPSDHETAKNGKWTKGPAEEFFGKLKEEIPNLDVIAEDLGYMTKEVTALREYTGFPGMKILQFAFSPYDESDYLPHNVERNWVMYTGTHDNETLTSWLENSPKETIDYAVDYLKLNKEEGYEWGLIRGVWSSVANLAIAQMQDFLCLGEFSRMNKPGTLGNWKWRVKSNMLTKDLADKIAGLTKLYSRNR
ncbi:4-alpha-glucanotransferase [Miniphocaeibacter halophilus]|uniref:4-alpha-glucanotransferase n=1 Tax=Miniphocaeibacter halophilus TaxID=2931922 RepID=A0AC61MNV6_9FIRM|nr:4-alpha-glucanotransferase [Miniphocaeibacter halophilus]QQK07180.1 4-alpha-glucanotransferase [Miniphocaeibacter halophilus]